MSEVPLYALWEINFVTPDKRPCNYQQVLALLMVPHSQAGSPDSPLEVVSATTQPNPQEIIPTDWRFIFKGMGGSRVLEPRLL